MAPLAPLTARHLGRATLARQGLLEPISAPPAEAVARIGSLQAQHPEWPPVALAARAANRRSANLAGALDRREVVRSSLMRITIHVVTAADLWPMFTVMRPLRLAQWRLLLRADPHGSSLGRRMTAAHEVAIAALRERPHSSLELDRLMAAEIGHEATAATRPAWRDPDKRIVVRAAWRHFAATVPLVHVPHDAEGYGRSRYALASDWLGVEEPEIDEAEARIHVARRYLGAFGPASVDDLVAYVGRGKGGIGVWRDAVAALGDEVVKLPAADGRTLVDLVDAPRPDPDTPAPPRLLARWDSLLLSHGSKHRQRVIADEHRSSVFSRNADVLPTLLLDGAVAGTWELARSEGRAAITLRPFARVRRRDAESLVAEAERVLGLLEPDAQRSVELAHRSS
jgi:hypothetical protein